MKTFLLLASLTAVEPTAPKVVPDMRASMVAVYAERVTSCVAEQVAKSGEYGTISLADLITREMEECKKPARDLVDLVDECYGKGVGEHYFFGRYLDTLPQSVESKLKAAK
jgi:hypothetical protein